MSVFGLQGGREREGNIEGLAGEEREVGERKRGKVGGGERDRREMGVGE